MIKIAIAEDHPLLAETIARILDAESNFKVVINVRNGQELLDALITTDVDLILLDLDMPILDGREALHIIKKKYKESIKIIILSLHDHSLFMARFIQAGANSYLSKCCDYKILKEAIIRVHETGKYCYDQLTEEQFERYQSKVKKEYPVIPGDALSESEINIVKMICQEMSCVDIAEKLNRSTRTIENHKQRIMKKIGAKNSVGIMKYAIKSGIHEVNI